MAEPGIEAKTMPAPTRHVRDALAAGSQSQQMRMAELRSLVFEVAASLDGIGTIEESLKWGQLTFSTVGPKSGSPFRIAPHREPGRIGLYFICTTDLVSRFREHYGDTLTFEDNRAIVLDCDEPLAAEPLKHCMAMALTYHIR